MKFQFLFNFFFFVSLATAQEVKVPKQKGTVLDTNYIVSFPEHLNGRIYFSRKFTKLTIARRNNREKLKYDPNTTLNFGVGATYKGFTLNLGYGFSTINEEQGKGETQYLDLQTHIYRSNKIIDVFGQFYEGMYLSNTKNFDSEFPDEFYLRPDIKIRLVGLNARWILNGERFSYSAPFVQNQLQQKSAGSVLIGFKAIALFTDADSNYLPYFVQNSVYGNSFPSAIKIRTTQAGPVVGYAYSLIVGNHFFMTAALNFGFLTGPLKFEDTEGGEIQEWQINLSTTARFAIGYNSPKWYLGFTYLEDGTTFRSIDGGALLTAGIGNVRFNYVKRFLLKSKK